MKTKTKAEGGNGGKRGHSSMVHYDKTHIVKHVAKRTRRAEDKKTVNEQQNEAAVSL